MKFKILIWISALCVFALASRSAAQTTPTSPNKEERKPLAPPQGDDVDEEDVLIYRDTVASDKREQPKPKKIPKRVYYGLKTRKAYTRTERNSKVTLELFYTLKEFQAPNPYVKDIYWFNSQKRKLIIGPIPEKEKQFARVLHGPYQKLVGGVLVEEGVFYVGTKHARWLQYNGTAENILIDKKKYYKGWPRESEISYYDADRKQFKEVTPIVNGKREGDYFYFFPSGAVSIQGKFENDRKVGVWREYFDNKKKLKKETQYPATGFDEPFEPYLLTEFDEKGTLVYDKAAEDKKKNK